MRLFSLPDLAAYAVIFPLTIAAGLALGVGKVVLPLYAHYYIMRDRDPKNASLYTFLALLLNKWIFELVVMNIVPVSVAGRRAGPRPKYDKYHQWEKTPSRKKKNR